MSPPDPPFALDSRYLTMRDGVRIAIDAWLPRGASPARRVPAILHQTRYYRSVDWSAACRRAGLDALLDINALSRRAFLRAGYAWIDVDVRGSGASTGSRPCPWWRDEVEDGAEIVRWIVAQPWSTGSIGATGVSYGGTTAELLLSCRVPEVKAIAPRFSLFDVYTDVCFPGGLHLSWFTERWSRYNRTLDQNRFFDAVGLLASVNAAALADLAADRGHPLAAALLDAAGGARAEAATSLLLRLGSGGVTPVAGAGGAAALRDAVAEHRRNFDVHTGALSLVHRDDTGVSDLAPDADIDTFSPHTFVDRLAASGAAVYGYSGWMDGAYAHAAIKRHQNLAPGQGKLLLGPWDHGGRQHISPFAPRRASGFDHEAELVRFFDHHLKGDHPELAAEPPVRYFTLGAERWRTAERWPPPHVAHRPWFLAPGRSLAASKTSSAGADRYRVDEGVGTGRRSRWRSLLGVAVPLGHGDRSALAPRMLCYTSAPLPDDLEVTGHPVVRLFLSADAPDAALFAYLEDVAPTGRVTLATEGQLRALHRKLADGAPPYRTAAPYRSFRRADAAPIPPGEVVELAFDLLPLSYVFPRGHAVRLSIAGADRDHFRPLPGPAPTLDVRWGGDHPSRIELPVAGG